MISQGLMTKEELEKELQYEKGMPLYDDTSWIFEQAEIFKRKYDEKREIVEETHIKIKEARKNQNTD